MQRGYRYRGFLSVGLVLVLTVLAGCGGGGQQTQQQQRQQQPSTAQAPAQVQEYVIPTSSDYSGPYADIMPNYDAGRNACAAWWNENVGKNLGVKIKVQTYDSRYDTSVVASNYPRMLSQYNPIAWMGLGGPDVAALLKRVPDDKVPLVMGTAAYGYGWTPNNWVVQPRPTYVHEYAGFLSWYLSQWKENRPLRIAILSAESPAYVDFEKGIKKFVSEKLKDRAEIVATEYSDPIPVDVNPQVGRILAAKADILAIMTNTPQVVAALNAMEQQGKKIPVVMSSHNGIAASARALGGAKRLEGSFDVYAYASNVELDVPAVTDAWKKYAGGKEWSIESVQGCAQVLLLGAGLKRAAEKHGASNLNGEKLYSVFGDARIPASEMLGLTPDLQFTHEQPFPVEPKVRITTVKDGQQVLATPDWVTVPALDKW